MPFTIPSLKKVKHVLSISFDTRCIPIPFSLQTVDPTIRQTRQLTFSTFEAAPLLAAPNGQVIGENRHSVSRCRHIELLLVI